LQEDRVQYLFMEASLTTREHLPEKLMWSIITQLVLALHYCHTAGSEPPLLEGSLSQNSNSSTKSTGQIVLHRDIKPENSMPLWRLLCLHSLP
jgi:serine/threonine protein kinase